MDVDYPGPTNEELRKGMGYHVKRGDRNCQRWRVSGQMQTWKRDPERFRIPVKFGLYSNDAITQAEVGNKNLYPIGTRDKCPFCGLENF